MNPLVYGIIVTVCVMLPGIIASIHSSRATSSLKEINDALKALDRKHVELDALKAHLDGRLAMIDEQVIDLQHCSRRIREAVFAAKLD